MGNHIGIYPFFTKTRSKMKIVFLSEPNISKQTNLLFRKINEPWTNKLDHLASLKMIAFFITNDQKSITFYFSQTVNERFLNRWFRNHSRNWSKIVCDFFFENPSLTPDLIYLTNINDYTANKLFKICIERNGSLTNDD